METLQTLHENCLNLDYIRQHELIQKDLEKVNFSILLIELSRSYNTPTMGDQIVCTNPDKIIDPLYKAGHLNSNIDRECASICVRPAAAPFVFHNGIEITKFSCSGGYWTAETDINMYVYIGAMEKLFCQWGHCGMAHSGAIYFHATVNEWLLIREDIE